MHSEWQTLPYTSINHSLSKLSLLPCTLKFFICTFKTYKILLEKKCCFINWDFTGSRAVIWENYQLEEADPASLGILDWSQNCMMILAVYPVCCFLFFFGYICLPNDQILATAKSLPCGHPQTVFHPMSIKTSATDQGDRTFTDL